MNLDNPLHGRHRRVAGREALRDRLADGEQEGPVVLRADTDRLVVERPGLFPATLPAVSTGPPLRIAFDPAVLLAAIDAGVGPHGLFEVASATEPVVVRSAGQGSFTTLVMPVRDTTTTTHEDGQP
ncbi:hypothetical protein [Microbispora catharanthi]|uniref:hypothetical protein n=1 Tax=Microbispora catharanthi TaxID=1712871 RepID=UPI00197C2DB2|nr:hypothetical protein [Microbispora catharanthi]